MLVLVVAREEDGMNMGLRKFKLIIILLIVFISVSLYFCFAYYTFQIRNCYNQCVENESDIIKISETLLNDSVFSQEGTYSICIDDNKLNATTLDLFDEKKDEINCSVEYIKIFDKIWLDKDVKIEINVFDSLEKGAVSSVTYKYVFFDGKIVIWVYYGDFSAFPSCPDSSARRDNIKKLTDNLYYAEHKDWF